MIAAQQDTEIKETNTEQTNGSADILEASLKGRYRISLRFSAPVKFTMPAFVKQNN